MDISFNRCQEDITDPNHPNLNIEIISNIFNRLRKNSHREEMFSLLMQKEHPDIVNAVAEYNDHFSESRLEKKLSTNHTDLLDLWCKKRAFGNHYTHLSKQLPIQIEGHFQKTSFKVDNDGNVLVLTMPIIGPDNYSSVNHFETYKIISSYDSENMKKNLLSKRTYKAKEELYRKQNDVYLNEPFYNKNPDESYQAKNNWLEHHELTNCLDTFSDNRFVLTHAWGGIEIHNGKNVEQFIIGNSISSVSCSLNNKHIALGSYDGTITIIDTTQEESTAPITKAHFKDYAGKKYADQKYPRILVSEQLSKNTINNIQYHLDHKTILFSSGKNLFCMKLLDNGLYAEHDILFASESSITHFTQINNFIACVSEKNILTIIDLNHKQKDISFQHTSSITAIHPYINEQDNHFITGDLQGNVCIWKIGSMDLIIDMLIPHNHPIHLVEVTKDNKHIVVKITEKMQNGRTADKKDNIIIYPTPHVLPELIQKQAQFISGIEEKLAELSSDPVSLYQLLSEHKETLYASNHEDIIELKNDIENVIIEQLKDIGNSLVGIESLDKFYNLLRSFPTTDPTKPRELRLSGMFSVEKLNLLESIDAKIGKILSREVLIPFFTKTLENKNLTYQNKVNLYKFTSYFYWYHFSGNSATPPSAELKSLIDTLMIIHDLENPKNRATYWKAHLNYMMSNHPYQLGAAALSIPLGYMIYKYYMDKK